MRAALTLVVAVCAVVCFKLADCLSGYGINVCSYQVTTSYQYYTTVSYGSYTSYKTCCAHFMWCWKKCTRYRWVRRYRNEVRYGTRYHTSYRCCHGWRQGSGSSSCLIPICNSPGCVHGRCVRPNTCSCSSGYTNPSQGCNADINECASSNGGCDQQCTNFPGSFRCSCRRGFSLVGNTRCQDNNECAVSHRICTCDDPANNPSCSATCRNTIGSYRCSCSPGYRLVGSSRCVDTNECMVGNGHCSHMCTNLPGSYRCSCHVGYRLSSNGKTCSDTNECLTNNGGCDHQCINRNGSFICRCRPGHTLDPNGRTCSDIDECRLHHNGCQHTCNNYRGGFYCSCRTGFQLSQNNKTCNDVDECNVYRVGANGLNSTISGCTQNCHNAFGTYTCSCNAGYKLGSDGKTCQDIDECITNTDHCQQRCINTMGSFVCKCLSGYRLKADGHSCDGLPCIRHPPVINGAGTCFFGKTNDTCRFRCNPGFNFRGSRERRCQANHTWSGSLPTCARKSCDELLPPSNGGIALPCFNYFQATCNMQCNNGYYATGPMERSCKATSNNTMYWNNAATRCEEITICAPNPCKHGGRCSPISVAMYQCGCNGTGYEGATCNRGVVQLPVYPIMDFGKEYRFQLAAKPENELRVLLVSNDKNLLLSPSKLVLNSSINTAKFTIFTNISGPQVLSYKIYGTDAGIFNTPINSIVYVRNQNTSKSLDTVINDEGTLSKGCHDKRGVRNSQTKRGYTFHSTDDWHKINDKESTDGVVLLDLEGTGLPTSLVGNSITVEQLVNNDFDQFINRHKISKNSRVNATREDKSLGCVSEKASTKYLNEAVELNAFAKTVADGVNQRTPFSFNLVAGRSAKTFNLDDFVANIKTGAHLKKLYPKCVKVLRGIADDMNYYAYSTNQKILLQIAEEEIIFDGGDRICIFESIDKNQTLVAFPDSAKRPELWKSSTGWSGKMSSIHLSNTNGKAEYRVFGEYSTELEANNVRISLRLNGDMSLRVSEAFEFFRNGIKATDSLSVSGKIALYIDDNSTGIMEKSMLHGHGSIKMNRSGDGYKERELVVKLDSTAAGSSRRLVQGRINLDKNASLVNKISIIDSGGSISENGSSRETLQREMRILNATIMPALQESLSRHPEVKNIIRGILNDLHLAVLASQSLSFKTKRGDADEDSASKVLPHLVDFKRHLNSIDRRLQVLDFKHRRNGSLSPSNGRIQEIFQRTFSRMQDDLKKPLNRTQIMRLIVSRSLFSTGTVCLQKLCFKDSGVEISHAVHSKYLFERFGIVASGDKVTYITAKLSSDVLLGDQLRLSKDSYIVQVKSRFGILSGFFNATLQIYGRQLKVAVLFNNSRLEFSTNVLLPDGSQTSIAAVSELKGVLRPNEVVFTIKTTMDSHTHMIRSINELLHASMAQMTYNVAKRTDTLRKAVNISEKQRTQAALHLKRIEDVYVRKTIELSDVEIRINKTVARFKNHKSLLIKRLKQHDSAIINYTKAIEECPPQVCLPKCVPGLVAGICFEDRYEHVSVQQCNVVAKHFSRTELKQESSQRYYVTYDPRTSCQTKCPPLTGFFKKLFGRRKRRSLAGEAQQVALVRTKRGIVTVLATKALKKVVGYSGEKLFKYLGGSAGAIGAKIGAMLPGPFGIVGMIVGGVIGSAFGSCEKLCTTKLIPKLNSYTHYEAIRVTRKFLYKVSECSDVLVRQQLGYKDGHECFHQSNCSETLTNVSCVSNNQHCHVIRMILREKIRQEGDLGPVFGDYERFSLTIENMEIQKRTAIQEKRNAYQSLLAAKALALKSNYSHEISRQSLATAHRLLSTELHVLQLVKRLGREAVSVRNGRFKYAISKGRPAPNVIGLMMDVERKDGLVSQITSLIDFQNMNISTMDATKEILRHLPRLQSRKRRSMDGSIDINVPVDEIIRNMTKKKCKIIEEKVLYLVEISIIFATGVSQFEQAKLNIANAELSRQNYTKSMQDAIALSTVCSDGASDAACSNDWLKAIYANATENSSSNIEISWKAKRADVMAKTEYFTKNQNFTNCGGAIDCVLEAIDAIYQTMKFDNSNASILGKVELSKWQPYFETLIEQDDLDENQTKTYASNIYQSIKRSQVTKVYCGFPPVILKDLPEKVIVTAYAPLQLRVDIAESLQEVSYRWEKDGEQLQVGSSNELILPSSVESSSGYYACNVSNKFGSVLSKVVQVIYEERPRITGNPADLTTTIKQPNSSIRLICNATGKPKPLIEWFFTSFNDTSNPINLYQNETILVMNTNGAEQSGFYYCNASNRQGFAVSRRATVHVSSSVIAEFAVDISFAVEALNRTFNGTVDGSRNETRIANETVIANESSSVGEGIRGIFPEYLTAKYKLILIETLSKTMNVSKSRILNVDFSRESPEQGMISTRIIAKDLNPLLKESADWIEISEDVVMSRKGLLVLPLWLQFYYSNMTSSLSIGRTDSVVNSETVQFALTDPLCPVGYSLNSNGFICEMCTAGTMFVPGVGCQKCPIGTFQPQQGALGCMACNSSHTTNSTGAVYHGDCILKEKPTTPPQPQTRKTTPFETTETLSTIHDDKETSSVPKKERKTTRSPKIEKKTTESVHTTSSSFEKPKAVKEENNKNTVIAASVVSFVIIAIFTIIVAVIFRVKKRTKKKQQSREDDYKTVEWACAQEEYAPEVKRAFRFVNSAYETRTGLEEQLELQERVYGGKISVSHS